MSITTISLASVGAYMGIVGGVFNSLPHNDHKLVAFGIWITSNFILASWAYSIGEQSLMWMYLIFIGTSTFGFYNHWNVRVKLNGNDEGRDISYTGKISGYITEVIRKLRE